MNDYEQVLNDYGFTRALLNSLIDNTSPAHLKVLVRALDPEVQEPFRIYRRYRNRQRSRQQSQQAAAAIEREVYDVPAPASVPAYAPTVTLRPEGYLRRGANWVGNKAWALWNNATSYFNWGDY